jgi:hypothetical protein
MSNKFVFSCFLIKDIGPHECASLRVGNLFPSKGAAESAGKAHPSFVDFNRIETYRSLVSYAKWASVFVENAHV